VESLSEEYRFETLRDVRQRVQDYMEDMGIHASVNFYPSSVWDTSVFETCSKIVKKLIPQASALENLMDALTVNSGIDKAFLFDINSRIYLATDSNPVDSSSFELCVDMIDLIVDLSAIYDNNNNTHGDTYSLVKLTNSLNIYYRQLDKLMGLICIIRSETFEKQGLLDYNVNQLREGINSIVKHQ